MSDRKYMDVKEFREAGYLQELNRQFLHPLGLAIEVAVDPDGKEYLGRIWDSRDDPEGIIFEGIDLKPKADNVYRLFIKAALTRARRFGYVVQPPIKIQRTQWKTPQED
jgi:hypothetical protein